jgi:glycyl-tRNA synthetase
MSEVKLEDIVSLAKRRGFIFPGSDVYGGLSGTWDYGPLGVALKKNIQNLWWRMFVEERDDMYGVDAAILMNQKVWQASGHVDTFTDPLVECSNCKSRFRADKVDLSRCPTCGKSDTFGEPRQFNMMFETKIGPMADKVAEIKATKGELRDVLDNLEENNLDEVTLSVNTNQRDTVGASTVWLRPETAQGIFTNFKNVVDTFYPDLPFGLAQQGKAFRNEISPRDFIFRSREFEQMEIEYFVQADKWEEAFEQWRKDIEVFLDRLGLPKDKIEEVEVPEEDRAHYSKRTIDYEFDFPHGKDELLGLAYRTDFDLMNIQDNAKKSMEYRPKDGGEPFVPHVIEPSFGLERTIMAVLSAAYTEDEINGEKRIFLKLPAHLAPVKVAVLPLAKNKPELVAKAREVYDMLKKEIGSVMWVDTGNIGKNYRKMDEIGVPYCVTVDFDTLEGDTKDTVTVRHRDNTEQQRVSVTGLATLVQGQS